jgi:hypothetical protein
MRTHQQRNRFKLSTTSIVIMTIILFTCSYTIVAQQKDGEESTSSSNTNNAPARSNVNFSFNFANLTLQNGEFLEMFGANSSRGILRGHPTIPGAELGTTTADPLIFSTNGAERMRIWADGSISIGPTTINPGAAASALDFAANSSTAYVPTGTAPSRLRLYNTNSVANGTMEINLGSFDSGGNLSTRVRLVSISTNQTPGLTAGDFVIGLRNNGGVFESTRFVSNGNVGIGTSAPGAKLQVLGVAPGGTAAFTGTNFSSHFNFNGDGTEDTYIRGGKTTSRVIIGDVNSGNVLTSLGAGNLGVGTATPTSKLHVQGSGRITGNLVVDGNIAAKYQDVAEWVPAAEQLTAGTVVVLDASKANQVISSNKSYDTRVAGVISTQPGIVLGEKSDDKVLVATTGRVLVNVDATNGPIQIGDLLVTSDREGFAMKSAPLEIGGARLHRPGTLIGKALEPLAGGTGKILVLLSLQ